MGTATNDRLTFISAVAVQAEIEELLPQFKRRCGIEVDVKYDVNPAVAKCVMDGEDFDVGLTNPWYVDEMISLGRVIPDIHVPFGRVPLTMGAAGPEPREIASSHEAVRRLLLNADSIAYTSTGTSGKTFLRAIEMMGLQDQIHNRLRPMGGWRAADGCCNGSSAIRHCPAFADHCRSRRVAHCDLSPGVGAEHRYVDVRPYKQPSGDSLAAHPIPVEPRIGRLSSLSRRLSLRAAAINRAKRAPLRLMKELWTKTAPGRATAALRRQEWW